MSASDEILPNAAGCIGNTPLVMLTKINKELPAKIAVKLEYLNPTGSVKDRAASNMIDEAEKQGLITPGKTVLLESTSGNMGIALAFYARIKGYKIILTMPATMSTERRALLKAFGAELIIVDPALGGKGMIERTRKIAESNPTFFWLNQFGNPANREMHYKTTGPEIWRQTAGKVDVVCFGVGSGGTISGTGRFLKEKNPEIKVFAVEPTESSVISGCDPAPHKIQGIGAGFVPDILDRSVLDEVLRVSSDDAIAMAKRLASEESILGGISSGANVWAAIQLAKRPENAGKLIVTTVNSFGERYLSTVLYNDIKTAAEAQQILSLEESLEVARKFVETAYQ